MGGGRGGEAEWAVRSEASSGERGARAGAARQLQPIRGGELMAERESQPQETTPAGGEEGSGLGGGGQEHRDQASSRPGPRKRPDRRSQLSLAQFLFLLAPASLPGGALPLGEKQPGECSSPSPLPAGSACSAGALPSSPLCREHPRGGSPHPHPPPPQGKLPGSAHCSHPSENTSGVKVRRTGTTPAGRGVPCTIALLLPAPGVAAARVPDPLQGAPSPPPRESPHTDSVPCSGSWGHPSPNLSSARAASRPLAAGAPRPIRSPILRPPLLAAGIPLLGCLALALAQAPRRPVPQGRMGGSGSPGWGLGWKMVVPGRSVPVTRGRPPAAPTPEEDPEGEGGSCKGRRRSGPRRAREGGVGTTAGGGGGGEGAGERGRKKGSGQDPAGPSRTAGQTDRRKGRGRGSPRRGTPGAAEGSGRRCGTHHGSARFRVRRAGRRAGPGRARRRLRPAARVSRVWRGDSSGRGARRLGSQAAGPRQGGPRRPPPRLPAPARLLADPLPRLAARPPLPRSLSDSPAGRPGSPRPAPAPTPPPPPRVAPTLTPEARLARDALLFPPPPRSPRDTPRPGRAWSPRDPQPGAGVRGRPEASASDSPANRFSLQLPDFGQNLGLRRDPPPLPRCPPWVERRAGKAGDSSTLRVRGPPLSPLLSPQSSNVRALTMGSSVRPGDGGGVGGL